MKELKEKIRKIILFNSDLTPPGEVADYILPSPTNLRAESEISADNILTLPCGDRVKVKG